ncbi:MAG: methyltransferase family protein [Promethearchaeati archaeon]
MIEWINFISLIASIFLFCIFYTFSLEPKKRSQKRGEKAWKECAIFRIMAGIFEFLILLNIILWIWFPLPSIDYQIYSNYWIGIGIGLTILIIGSIIMTKGIIDAGSETAKPSEKTEMYEGIYKFIRHPQSLGEFPMFIAMGFLVNSWTIVIILTLFIVIYVPIMIHYEEKDLIRRFGNKYKEYQKTTGALIPKFRNKSGNKG